VLGLFELFYFMELYLEVEIGRDGHFGGYEADALALAEFFEGLGELGGDKPGFAFGVVAVVLF